MDKSISANNYCYFSWYCQEGPIKWWIAETNVFYPKERTYVVWCLCEYHYNSVVTDKKPMWAPVTAFPVRSD